MGRVEVASSMARRLALDLASYVVYRIVAVPLTLTELRTLLIDIELFRSVSLGLHHSLGSVDLVVHARIVLLETSVDALDDGAVL